MTEQELEKAVEDCALPPEAFGHREHVRLAWHYLETRPLLSAIAAFSTTLRRFAAHHGAEAKYNETMTVAYLLMIAERRWRSSAPFEAFAAENRDLLDDGRALLGRFYDEGALSSARARASFILPDAAGQKFPCTARTPGCAS
jgi:hypothetical protein